MKNIQHLGINLLKYTLDINGDEFNTFTKGQKKEEVIKSKFIKFV